jgi:hypothetical protein
MLLLFQRSEQRDTNVSLSGRSSEGGDVEFVRYFEEKLETSPATN